MKEKQSKKTNSYNFMAFLSRLKYINRWSLMKNTCTENIAEHSLQVAMIAHILAVIKNKYFNGNVNAERCALLALYHDASETITGDLPTPIKYFNHEMREVFKNIENKANEKIISMLPEDLQDVYRDIFTQNDGEEWILVKAADKISAYIKCIEEEKSGNNEFKEAKKSLYSHISKLGLSEVDFFMEKFVPGFYLSLDELK
ncbi:5'-deoxynucleotidase [Acetivibrio saccincola]|jgi:5'-deoxynucleotidase|uniref:5'-deoxynucleotidase n=1 Tax=Acetivibrio saccincola TaxID=1677857 RepID=A0A2K9DY74_9FIRM|nr:5'-deoxynucleotidase [Acetivibrio saccincola]AUG56462.1 5'-deoxynucleotidase YfbR [Acetivibrio saccincola]NLW27680.1 5'-deoxynucleotidase [Acetivibrio saccincola]PQQ66547.1 5'-deoxynucleotidase [Acetivibrio saccincola]HOA96764.1 5'-deoxynucleotidase [Acetivibrio saccincola]HQD28483.1 5'-deoxynucleotidase [Acetivibrio saccincola]